MLKFDIIDSKQQNSKINSFALCSDKNECSMQDNYPPLGEQSSTTFIVAEGTGKSIMGGAYLVKKNLDEVNEDIIELITFRTFQEGFVWECSSIYLELSSTFPPAGSLEAEKLTRIFYRGLYEEFVAFGEKNKIGFVIMRLAADVYISTKDFGLWPYVVELKPMKSSDGLFHGVLPLMGSQYEAYNKAWDALDSYFKDRSCFE